MPKNIPTNQEIAAILEEIGLILDAEETPYKPEVYEEAAAIVRGHEIELAKLYKECGTKCIDDLPHIGESITKKIEELLTTGRLKYFDKLKKKYPLDMVGITAIQDIGPKTAVKLYKKLKVKTVAELLKAAKAGKVAKLQGFGEKSEKNIIEQVGFLKGSKGRLLLHQALPAARTIIKKLEKVPGVTKVDVTGSIRRRKETCGDIDLVLTTTKPEAAKKAFASLPEVQKVYQRGGHLMLVRYKSGVDGDLQILKPSEYASVLHHFTGNKEHNIQLRKMALKKGLSISEHGVTKGKRTIPIKTEEALYKKLGLQYIPPELRVGKDEIERAKNKQIPTLIPYDSLKGDLQVQSSWTDGDLSIKELAAEAKAAGLSYIAVTDHSKSLAMMGGLDERELARQGKEIDKLNVSLRGFKILKSIECDILKDGKLDLTDKALASLDLVGVSVHSHRKMSEKAMTERIITAMKHPSVNILFHPTGRIVTKRDEYKVDIARIIKAAKEYGVALEVNASDRLDLRDVHIRMAVESGVKLVISSDAHHAGEFQNLEYGIATARRGWARKADVLNTKPVTQFLKAIKALKKN